MTDVKKYAGVLGDLFTIGKAIASALGGSNPERVRAVVSDELATSLAKAAADVRASQKFLQEDGDDDGS